MYRQGDVLIIPVKSIPESAAEMQRDNGRVILAYGEVTGHAHAIKHTSAVMLADNDNRYLRLVEEVPLIHEEHNTINLPAGNYRIVIQREWSLEDGMIRPVLD